MTAVASIEARYRLALEAVAKLGDDDPGAYAFDGAFQQAVDIARLALNAGSDFGGGVE